MLMVVILIWTEHYYNIIFMRLFTTALLVVFLISSHAQQNTGTPKPTKQQLAWHEMEFYFFIHFGPNTFTDKEWGHGDEPEDIFNPTQLDCRQWARIAKQAGANGIIITEKHHERSEERRGGKL